MSKCLANSPNCCSGQYDTPATCPSSGVEYYSYFSKQLQAVSTLRILIAHNQRAIVPTHMHMHMMTRLLCSPVAPPSMLSLLLRSVRKVSIIAVFI